MTDDQLTELSPLADATGHDVSIDDAVWYVTVKGSQPPRIAFVSGDAEEVREYLAWRTESQWWWLDMADESISVQHPTGSGVTTSVLITDLAAPEAQPVRVHGGVCSDFTSGDISSVFVREGQVPDVGRWYK